jgi:hypothetical protein
MVNLYETILRNARAVLYRSRLSHNVLYVDGNSKLANMGNLATTY